MKKFIVIFWSLILLSACHLPSPPDPPDQDAELIAKGREIFFNETFNGNGRTCGSCHPAENNFTIDPTFIATLPDDDHLFVAEFNPDLKENFENTRLIREFGLITENLDGFDDLANKFTLRGVPHTLTRRARASGRPAISSTSGRRSSSPGRRRRRGSSCSCATPSTASAPA